MAKSEPNLIVYVPHYLSVDVYAELAIEIPSLSKYKSHMLVLSDADMATALSKGVGADCISAYETALNAGSLSYFDVGKLNEKFPDAPWNEIVASERSFTDYSFTFGGTGSRVEDRAYVVPFVTKLVAYFDEAFDRLRPQAIVSVFGDNIFTHIATVVAEQKGIAVFIPHSSYLNESHAPQSGYIANNRFLESYEMVRNYIAYQSRDLTKDEIDRCMNFEQSLMSYNAKDTLQLIYNKKDYERPFTPNLKSIFSYILHQQKLNKAVHFYKVDFLKKIRANLLRIFRNYRITKFISKNSKPLPKDRFVFFPMHFQPEASTLVNGIWYSNQIALIENLSKSLPMGYTLVVKEHPRGRGVRPLWQYKHIDSFYNVQFSDLDSKYILSYCDAVITISGSIGLEALAFKKPVIMLGRTFHSFNKVYYRANCFESLTRVLRDILLNGDFLHRPHLQEEIHKTFLAYISSLYHFFPFGQGRKSLAEEILSVLNQPHVEIKNWLSSHYHVDESRCVSPQDASSQNKPTAYK